MLLMYGKANQQVGPRRVWPRIYRVSRLRRPSPQRFFGFDRRWCRQSSEFGLTKQTGGAGRIDDNGSSLMLDCKRLAITGITRHHPPLTSDEKLSMRLSRTISLTMFSFLKKQMLHVFAEVYGASGEDRAYEFLAQAAGAYGHEGDEHERYELFNLLFSLATFTRSRVWLGSRKIEGGAGRRPEWTIREHPDFNSWIGGEYPTSSPQKSYPTSRD